MNIFIFNRGLRIVDNTTLIKQIKTYGNVVPIFIFPPEQIDPIINTYFSNNCVQFMIESLHELYNDIKKYNGELYFFKGTNIDVLNALYKYEMINSVGLNFDYTPYARQRSDDIQQFCKSNKINFLEYEDYLIHDILDKKINKLDGTPYLKFTPFKTHCINTLTVRPVDKFNEFKFYKLKHLGISKQSSSHTHEQMPHIKYNIPLDTINTFYKENVNINVRGGRINGLKIINNIGKFKTYQEQRDTLIYKTTFLGAYMHFMTISIREVYHKTANALGVHCGLISEYYWRDFYAGITFNFKHVLQGQLCGSKHIIGGGQLCGSKHIIGGGQLCGSKRIIGGGQLCGSKHIIGGGQLCGSRRLINLSYKQPYDNIKWITNKKWFNAWCNGSTGFPVIDAAMNQLNTIGFQHNRCRMLVASFLTKDMHIDWRKGEKYFATQLVDYDVMSNNQGWMWSTGNGTDAQPYFRIFNPWTQQIKFDKNCEYIKKWIPELLDIPNADIHNWHLPAIHNKWLATGVKYYKPILDHNTERDLTLTMYKAIKE